jgi:catechol 2,3-dioxygenase-like lactoylglutathione lyase family enzyme
MAQLCEVAIFTDRVDETLEFYRLLLATDPLWRSADGGQFSSGQVKVLVHRSMPRAPGMPPNETHVAVGVADVDAAAAALLRAGLAIVAGPADYDWGRSAYLRDPDGRLVEVTRVVE